MKRITLILALVFAVTAGAFAQLDNPVTWAYVAKKTGKVDAIVYIKATIKPGWHIYSLNLKPGGPNKTIFTFAKSKDYVIVGNTTEPKGIAEYEKVFKMNVTYFEKSVVFQQKVKLNKGTTIVKGTVEYSACNDSGCLPPKEVDFSIPVK